METFHWTSSSGRLSLRLNRDQAETCSHPGDCEADVRSVIQDDDIASQVAGWDAESLKRELREYGAWDDGELADHGQNKVRMLWLAAGDCLNGEA